VVPRCPAGFDLLAAAVLYLVHERGIAGQQDPAVAEP
jgi:hypothetical protein